MKEIRIPTTIPKIELECLMSPQQVAAFFNIDQGEVWRLTKIGSIRAIKISPRVFRYRPSEVLEAVEKLKE